MRKTVTDGRMDGHHRARNSHLQTRKMRVEIQFCELKILALEKTCEFNNLPVANTKSYLKDVFIVKGSGKQNFPVVYKQLQCHWLYLHFQPGLYQTRKAQQKEDFRLKNVNFFPSEA